MNTKVAIFIANKNNFYVTLQDSALSNLFKEDTANKITAHFSGKLLNPVDISLDDNTSLKFVNFFEKTGVSILDVKRNVQVIFLQQSWERLEVMKPLLKCYADELELANVQAVKPAIPKVKAQFERFFYSSHNNLTVVKNILRSANFNNIAELELSCLCFKIFINIINAEKNNVTTID